MGGGGGGGGGGRRSRRRGSCNRVKVGSGGVGVWGGGGGSKRIMIPCLDCNEEARRRM